MMSSALPFLCPAGGVDAFAYHTGPRLEAGITGHVSWDNYCVVVLI
jgi:hypothetical protein